MGASLCPNTRCRRRDTAQPQSRPALLTGSKRQNLTSSRGRNASPFYDHRSLSPLVANWRAGFPSCKRKSCKWQHPVWGSLLTGRLFVPCAASWSTLAAQGMFSSPLKSTSSCLDRIILSKQPIENRRHAEFALLSPFYIVKSQSNQVYFDFNCLSVKDWLAGLPTDRSTIFPSDDLDSLATEACPILL
jgi:hypothetical protein